jgi:hypothetical protein
LRFVEVVGEDRGVVTAERFKANDVEWLQSMMSTVRRKYGKEYNVSVAIVDKVHLPWPSSIRRRVAVYDVKQKILYSIVVLCCSVVRAVLSARQ